MHDDDFRCPGCGNKVDADAAFQDVERRHELYEKCDDCGMVYQITREYTPVYEIDTTRDNCANEACDKHNVHKYPHLSGCSDFRMEHCPEYVPPASTVEDYDRENPRDPYVPPEPESTDDEEQVEDPTVHKICTDGDEVA